MITAIFFDIDDTLIDHKTSVRKGAEQFHKKYQELFPEPSSSFVMKWDKIAQKHIKRYLAGEIDFQQQRRERIHELFNGIQVFNESEADVVFNDFLIYYEENWSLFPDVMNALDQLSHYPLGIISNGESQQQRDKLIKTGIFSCFSQIVISSDIQHSKPDKFIFDKACSLVGVLPESAIFIGDNLLVDAQGSINAGMKGIWLNRKGVPDSTGIPSIKSLSDILPLIE